MLTIRDIRRIVEAKYRTYTERVIAEYKKLGGDAWERYTEDVQRGHSIFLFEECVKLLENACRDLAESLPDHELELLWFESDDCLHFEEGQKAHRGNWINGVAEELFNLVTEVAGDVDLDDHDEDEPFEMTDEDQVFLSLVIEILESQMSRTDLGERTLRGLPRAIAGLKALPGLTADLDAVVSFAIVTGNETLYKSLSICSDTLEFSGGSSTYLECIGSDSNIEDGFSWYAGGESVRDGDQAEWIMGLEDLIASGASVSVSIEGDEDE